MILMLETHGKKILGLGVLSASGRVGLGMLSAGHGVSLRMLSIDNRVGLLSAGSGVNLGGRERLEVAH